MRPDASVKVSKISGISDNIKMELAAKDVRIEAPIPGHNAVGIEIPNVESTPVRMKELITRIPVALRSQKMLFVLGKDLLGNTVTCRLDKMPHLLIAGATGSGKSVCINSIITSFLLRTKPDEVKLLLIDPKKVEFTQYAKIPHLIGPVISDAAQASNALKVIVQIMEQRYEVATLLNDGMLYSDILEKTGASSATISRVNRSLLNGAGGYENVLERMKEQEEK